MDDLFNLEDYEEKNEAEHNLIQVQKPVENKTTNQEGYFINNI